MKLIYTTVDLLQAQLFSDELQQLGIPVEIFNRHSSGGLGDLPASYPELWIKRDSDEQRARGFIGRFESRLKSSSEQTLFCPSCREENQANFDLCWSCATSLD